MFGQDENNQGQNNNQDNGANGSAPVPEPVADASLGTDSNAPSVSANTGFNLPGPASLPIQDITSSSAPATDDDLLSIKQEALQQLSPLVSHLEQTPEEKFRTTMMMIQASDNQSLIKDAYESAKKITDEKVRAQALLDIVNEINYFTQQHNS
jgi:hypothetical protein